MIPASFPADRVPDGAALGPHHVYIGLLLALLALAVVWDDRSGVEPWVGAVGLLTACFAFATVWTFYPDTGAVLSLTGVAVAIASTALPFWSSYPWIGPRGVLLIGAVVALDDVAEHAFGVPTPLDWLWTEQLVQHIH